MTNSYKEEGSSFIGVYNGYKLKLNPVTIENSRIVNGNQFPYGLQFEEKPDFKSAVEFLKDLSTDGHISKLIVKHGALLIRGAGDPSAQGFSSLVTTIETARGLTPFEQIGLAGKRHIRAENVFTANEGPKTTRFYQHNEYSRYTHFPRCIHFFCSKAAPVGGGSPLASSVELFQKLSERLPKDVISKLSQRRIKSSQLYPSKSGKITFKGNEFYWEDGDSFGHYIDESDTAIEDKKAKAEKSIRRLTDDFEWNEDGSVTIHQYVPAFRIHPELQVPVNFNGFAGRHGTRRNIGALEPPYIGKDKGYYPPMTFENGEPISNDILDLILDTSLEIEYNHKWQEGDLVLVDNYQTSHGREPWDGGDRVVLVSMWDDNSDLKIHEF